ncbi:hypothetical protein JYU34_008481 [Plutella xylostella]|uniref:Uncharacterized protein n=1 Tax=Plutella xylostella TaxID=51655 RepID=A0ABQ7QM09_PLUXY|nr:hypothetical protein JYU34_008481 [Plutella xylostella]
MKGIIDKSIGSRMFMVHIPSKQLDVKKHVDQLLLYKGSITNGNSCEDISYDSVSLEKTGDQLLLPTNNVDEDLSDSSFTSITSPVGSPPRQVLDEGGPSMAPVPGSQGIASDHDETHVQTSSSDNECENPCQPDTRRYPIRTTRNLDANYKL